jgi:hypothetical protein
MQQINNSSHDVFTIADAPNIVLGFDPKKPQHVLTQMQTHLRNSINNKFVFPFPKYELIYIYIYIYNEATRSPSSFNNAQNELIWYIIISFNFLGW